VTNSVVTKTIGSYFIVYGGANDSILDDVHVLDLGSCDFYCFFFQGEL